MWRRVLVFVNEDNGAGTSGALPDWQRAVRWAVTKSER